ncbi:MAG: hypothetical protein IH955_09875 [Chloroflexi bacterium]|nr:hypothetical protein [Chloroflexota bacterium]
MVNDQVHTIGVRVRESGPFLMAPDFLSSANNLLRLLGEIDIALSPSLSRTSDWTLKELYRHSPAAIVVEPVVREGQLDNRSAIIDTVMEGIAELKERDIRPRYFSDQALNSARELVSVLGDRVHQVEVFTPTMRIVCNETIAANVREILHPGREMVGSIEGFLEAMNSHRGFTFALYEPVLASRVDCQLDPDLDERELAQLKKRIYDLYENRVRVSGALRTNRKGEVRSAIVRDVETLRTNAKFSDAKAVSGIFDITGGLGASEYVRRMRDAG